ncbi:MAG: type II secretion system F family protein [Firmicutes bacterium]|nr:type II secretion system F family protein [Bacillota bacterium]MBQ3123117.1 type II secretion system F family protein [Bacillota bacterium]MBQ9972944.1 type II secretion system F family protein [Bacillota bacterium]
MELPEFTNKLVLLLNAGLVLRSAIEIIAEEESDSILSRELRSITLNMKSVNSTFEDEFRNLARKTGLRELLRLSNIFTDNIDKGSELVKKLDIEASFMWQMSKKQVEERGRIAESKLTFPMALMLLSLILVTSAPALMYF